MSAQRFFTLGPPPMTSGAGVDLLDVSTDQAKYTAGQRIADSFGNEYVRVESADASVTAGNTLRYRDFFDGGAPGVINADVDAVAAIGTNLLVGTGDFAAFDNGDDGLTSACVVIDAGVGRTQLRWIRRIIDANTIEVTEPWTIALDATSDYIVYRPWAVQLHAADTTPVIAISMANVATVGDFFWAQVAGIANVSVDGSEDPILPGDIVTQSQSASGLVEGRTALGTTLADVAGMVGIGMNDALIADDEAPVKLNLLGKM